MDGSDYSNYAFDCKYFISNHCADFVHVLDVVACACVTSYVTWPVSLHLSNPHFEGFFKQQILNSWMTFVTSNSKYYHQQYDRLMESKVTHAWFEKKTASGRACTWTHQIVRIIYMQVLTFLHCTRISRNAWLYRGLLTQLAFLLFSIFSLCRMYYQVDDPQTMVLLTDEGPYT